MLTDNAEHNEVIECELPEYAGVKLHAAYVVGTSMNKVMEDGGKVVYVNVYEVIGGLQQDDYVVVSRPNSAGQHEVTVKQLNVTHSGARELWPRSTDSRWQTPIIIPPQNNMDQEEIQILGVVVDYRPPKLRRSGIPVRI